MASASNRRRATPRRALLLPLLGTDRPESCVDLGVDLLGRDRLGPSRFEVPVSAIDLGFPGGTELTVAGVLDALEKRVSNHGLPIEIEPEGGFGTFFVMKRFLAPRVSSTISAHQARQRHESWLLASFSSPMRRGTASVPRRTRR